MYEFTVKHLKKTNKVLGVLSATQEVDNNSVGRYGRTTWIIAHLASCLVLVYLCSFSKWNRCSGPPETKGSTFFKKLNCCSKKCSAKGQLGPAVHQLTSESWACWFTSQHGHYTWKVLLARCIKMYSEGHNRQRTASIMYSLWCKNTLGLGVGVRL